MHTATTNWHRMLKLVAVAGVTLLWLAPEVIAEAQESVPHQTWYVLVDGERAWGTTRMQFELLPDSTSKYIVDTRVLVEVLGTQQELKGRSMVVVDRDLAPLQLESEATSLSGSIRMDGKRTDAGFVMNVHHGEAVSTSTHSLDDRPSLVASVALESWLNRLPPSTTSTKLRLLEVESGSVRVVTAELIERSDDGVTWRIDPGKIPGEFTVRIGADGLATEQVHRYPPIRIVRHDDASSLTLAHRVTSVSELLMLAVDRPLPPLRKIQELKVQISWRDIDPQEFGLEDSRQVMQSIVNESGQFKATVALTRSKEIRGDYDLPNRDALLTALLAGSEMIQPNDPGIRKTAREIIGEISQASDAARAICKWTAAYIEPTMVAETLSGPEVLRRRKGKCTEYSTLFASLARAAGIPTRIALGVRAFPAETGHMWGGHMWNEVWLGEWVPVDASAGEFGGSPALLKFIDSDTVEGTQQLRWKLASNLAISVLDIKANDARQALAGDPDVVDGLHEGGWTSVAQGIRFQLPENTWRIENVGPAGNETTIRIRPAEESDPGDSAMIHLVSFDLADAALLKQVIQARLHSHRLGLKSLEVLQDEATTIAGATGHRISFRGEPKDAPSLRVTELIWYHEGTGCLLNLISTEELHEPWLKSLDRIAGTFEFLE